MFQRDLHFCLVCVSYNSPGRLKFPLLLAEYIRMKDANFVTDYIVHGSGYAAEATCELFSEKRRLQRWLDVEVALAHAQSQLGVIPDGVHQELKQKAKIENFDLFELKKQTDITKHSLMPLLDALDGICTPSASAYLHKSATTQDIQDTALAMEMKEVFRLVKLEIRAILCQMSEIIEAHKDTLMVGRTHSMPASPITFGLKIAGWADDLMRSLDRIEEAEPRICVAQMFGSVGSLAAFDGKGRETLRLLAESLDLHVPMTCWHASRDRVAEFVFIMAMVSTTVARFADELRTLNRAEIREVIMGFKKGEIGSSCMPHKRNPEDAEQIVVLGRLAKAQVGPMLESMIQEHERDYRGTRMEWPCVIQSVHYSYNALCIFKNILNNIYINKAQIVENAEDLSQFLFVERLLGYLSPKMGRKRAYSLVYNLTQISQDSKEDIKLKCMQSEELLREISRNELMNLFDIGNYLGEARQVVEQVSAKIRIYTHQKTEMKAA